MLNSAALDNIVRDIDPSVSDDALAAQLQANLTTMQPIPLALLVPWMNDGGRVARLRRTMASSTFAAVVAGAGQPVQATIDSLSDALDYLYSPANQTLDTTDATRGAKTYGLLQLMQAVNGADATLGMTPDEATAFLAFGLGLAWGPNSVQASDVTASRARLALAAGKATLLSWLSDKYVAAIAACDAGQVAGTLPTKAQLQAVFDPQS